MAPYSVLPRLVSRRSRKEAFVSFLQKNSPGRILFVDRDPKAQGREQRLIRTLLGSMLFLIGLSWHCSKESTIQDVHATEVKLMMYVVGMNA